MSDLQAISNRDLATKTQELAQEERRITSVLLHHLREIERRMLFAELGYSSLIEYCVKELKYSESAAYRRISAMRLMREVPEVEAKLQAGDLSLSTLAKAQTFFKQAEKQLHEHATLAEKRNVLKTLENLSSRETDRALAERRPELVEVPSETQRALKNEKVQVTLVLDKGLQEKLTQIQSLRGRKMSMLELIEFMTDRCLLQLKKKRGMVETSKNSIPPAPAEASPSPSDVTSCPSQIASTSPVDGLAYRKATPPSESKAMPKPGSASVSMPGRARTPLSVHTQRFVWRRDQGCCQYRSPGTHKKCGSRHYLEIEHIVPIAKGGSNDTDNLQLLCRTHNRYRAVREFGRNKMSRYLASMQ